MIRKHPLKATYSATREEIENNGREYVSLQGIIECQTRLEKLAAAEGVFLRKEAVEYGCLWADREFVATQGVPWWEPVELLGGPWSGELYEIDRAGRWTTEFPKEIRIASGGKKVEYRRRGINSDTGRYAYSPIIYGDDNNWEMYVK